MYIFGLDYSVKKIFFKIKLYSITLIRILLAFLENGYECYVCGKNSYLFPICKKCRNEQFDVLKAINYKRCKVCGKTLISTFKTCTCCRENKIIENVDIPFSIFSYRLWNKELMFLWKTEGVRILSFLFAGFYSAVLKSFSVKYIVPVPPRPGKIQEKGWDQIEDICNYLEYFYNFTVLRLLVRKSKTQQKKLDREHRLDTISMAYEKQKDEKVKKILKCCKNMFPEKVCLIDDVCTTGATLESCAKLLKEFGIKKIYSVTLFAVD